VEFALLLPLFLSLVLGLIEYGWFFYVNQLVVNSAREGVRVGAASKDATACGSTTGAQNFLQNAYAQYSTNCTIGTINCAATVNSTLSVTQTITCYVRSDHGAGGLTGFLGSLVPTKAVATATMRAEWN
jgi:Flp pilus assembly protein TadG